MVTGQERADLFRRGVAHIMNGEMMFLLIKRHLERQDGEHLVDIALDRLDAPLFPGPYLRRDIIIDGDGGLGVHELRDAEVEARIVDEDDDIRAPCHDILLAERHIAEDGAQMEQHGDEAHVSQIFVMAHTRAAFRSHEITPEETELSLRVFLLQGVHQTRGMEVTAGLAYNQIVSHCSSFKKA